MWVQEISQFLLCCEKSSSSGFLVCDTDDVWPSGAVLLCGCSPVGQALLLFKRSRDLHHHGKLLNVGNWTFSKHPYGPQCVIGHPALALPPPSSWGPQFPRAQPWCGDTPPLLPLELSRWGLGMGIRLMSASSGPIPERGAVLLG